MSVSNLGARTRTHIGSLGAFRFTKLRKSERKWSFLGEGFARFRRLEVVELFDSLSVCSLLD
jgi:hypothetical protein